MFVPVTSPHGSGEYARSLAIAGAVARRWPDAALHFLVSRHAPYATKLAYPVTRLPASPTLHTPEVRTAIEAFVPTLVIFDNAGRTAQLRAARASGARVVFVSSRRRQRHRAFRLQWMRLLDEHWFAWPRLMAGPLSLSERTKHWWLQQPRLRHLDTVLPEPAAAQGAELLAAHGLEAGDFVLVVPGGGSGHPRFAHGPAEVGRAAARIAAAGLPTLLLGVPAAAGEHDPPALHRLPRLDTPTLMHLLRTARLVVCNGGDTLLQATALGRPCVATALVPDQRLRLRRLEQAGLAAGVPLAADAIVTRALALLDDDAARDALAAAGAALRIDNAMPEVLAAIAGLHEADALSRPLAGGVAS